ncbi:MAG: transposase [Polyangia bacterium]
MDSTSTSSGNWETVEAQLPAHWRDIAEQHGLVPANVPAQLGAKVTDMRVPLRTVLYRVGTNCSLKTAAASAFAGEVMDVSPVAVHLWERKLGPFFASLVADMAGTERKFAAECWAGYDIVVVDASVVSRPGAEGTTARVHYALRLTTLRPVNVQVTDDKGGETFRRFDPQAGELWMGDRGYANPPGIAFVKSSDAEALVRYNRGSLPLYDIGGKHLDVLAKLLSKLRKPGRVREWAVWVHPENSEPIGGRLVAVRLPADKAEEARERLRREQGSEVTAESLAMADFVVVFTTVPKNRLSAERVLELYGLRWQIELHIKRDKSIAGLDRLPNRRPDTVYTWICAKLLLVQIARKMASSQMAVPPSGLWAQLLAHGSTRAARKAKTRSRKEPSFGRASRQ